MPRTTRSVFRWWARQTSESALAYHDPSIKRPGPRSSSPRDTEAHPSTMAAEISAEEITDALERAGGWMNHDMLMFKVDCPLDREREFIGVLRVMIDRNEIAKRSARAGAQYCLVGCLPPPEAPTRARASGRGRRRGRSRE